MKYPVEQKNYYHKHPDKEKEKHLEKKNNDKPQDQRIERAEAVKDAMEHKGVKILFEEYRRLQEDAFRNLIDEGIDASNLELRQKLYNQIGDWLKIPDLIIADGNSALEELRAEEERPQTFIKRAIPFLGRRD
jgi:hypothetical protein